VCGICSPTTSVIDRNSVTSWLPLQMQVCSEVCLIFCSSMICVFCIRCGPTLAAASFDLAGDGTAWVMDVVGRLWFTTDVSVSQPAGSGFWWQVRRNSLVVNSSNRCRVDVCSCLVTVVRIVNTK